MKKYNLVLSGAIFSICIILIGCSKKDSPQNNAPTTYFGERLLNIVDQNPNISPLPTAIKDAASECKFNEIDNGSFVNSNDCTIIKSAPKRSNPDEKGVSITAETPRCCLGPVMISQANSDNDGGLFLFSNLDGVTTKPLQCDSMEDAKLSIVEKNGNPKFVVAEYASGGSGGTSVDTIIFYGKTSLDCEYFAAKEKALYKAHNSLAKNSSPPSTSASNESPFSSMDNTQFQICNAYDVIFRAESLFANVKYNEKILMQELQAFAAEKERRGISDADSNLVTLRIKNDINARFKGAQDKMAFTNKMSLTCGLENKL